MNSNSASFCFYYFLIVTLGLLDLYFSVCSSMKVRLKIVSTLLKGLNQLYGLRLTSIKYCTNVSCFIMIFSQIL